MEEDIKSDLFLFKDVSFVLNTEPAFSFNLNEIFFYKLSAVDVSVGVLICAAFYHLEPLVRVK